MLVVRQEQLAHFETLRLEQFNERLLEHVRRYFPVHWRVTGRDPMLQLVRSGVRRAREGGYPSERDAFMFVSLMLYLGSDFDTDPQYPWLAAALHDDAIGRRSERLEKAFDAAIKFVKSAAGLSFEHQKAAFGRAHGLLSHELKDGTRITSEYVLSTMQWLWPQKHAATGEDALRKLMAAAVPKARSAGIAAPEDVLFFVVAAFLFGHGIDRDGQLPAFAELFARAPGADAARGSDLRQVLAAHLAKLAE